MYKNGSLHKLILFAFHRANMRLFHIHVERYNSVYIYYLMISVMKETSAYATVSLKYWTLYYLMILVMKETRAYATVSLKYWTFYAIFLHMKIRRIALLLINNNNHVS